MKLTYYITRFKHLFLTDSLFRNAALLMSSTAIMSVLGFVFWLFVAHLYTPSQIGIASALISITTLISNLSLLGFNSGLIRFLPRSKNQSADINAAAIIVAVVTMLAALLYVLGGRHIGLQLAFLASPWHKAAFVFLMTSVSLNSLTDAVFIANRRAEFHTLAYAVLGIVKLIVPLFLVSLGSLGIFSAYIISMVVSLLFSVYLMYRYCGYKLRVKPNLHFFRTIRKYTTNNYLGVITGGLPGQVLPVVIVHQVGSPSAAYFSMAWMMANLLYVAPTAATQSMLAESSFDPAKAAHHMKHTIRLLSYILVPSVVVAIVVAPFLLRIFGPQYSAGSTMLFQILAAATFFVAANAIGGTVMNIRQRSGGVLLAQAVTSAVTLLAIIPLIHHGLVGVGFAILSGYAAGTIAQTVFFLRSGRRAKQGDELPSPQVVSHSLAAYGLEHADIGNDLGGGDRSSTLLVTDGDRKYVLKVWNSQKRSIEDAKAEAGFTTYLKAHGVPVPTIIPSPSGNAIAQVNDSDELWLGSLMQFEPGTRPASYDQALVRNMAHLQARIHLLGLAYAGLIAKRGTGWRRMLITPGMSKLLPKGISHFDYDISNLLVRDGNITCVIDFEGMRYDHVAICVYFTLTKLYHDVHDRRLLRDYLSAYQQVRKLNWAEKFLIQVVLAARYARPSMLLLTR